MGIPLLVVAFPPLLVLYPTSYVVFLLRTLLAKRPPGPKLLSDGRLVDPRKPHREHNDPSYAAAAAALPLIHRVGGQALPFCEDVLVWGAARVAIFSSDSGRPEFDEGEEAPDGALMLYNLDSREVSKLEIDDWPNNHTFHPLGVGLRETEGGNEAVLAVVNIGKHFAAVEVLRLTRHDTAEGVESKHRVSAAFLHTLENPRLNTPNAVVPLSEESVLVTNSLGFSPQKHGMLAQLEMMLAAPFGSLLHLSRGEYITREEGANAEAVSSCIAMANGLALSSDNRLLLVAGCTSNNVHVYDIDPPVDPNTTFDSDFVRFRETIPVGFCIDNLRFHAERSGEYIFLGAGHPSGLAYLATAQSKGAKVGPSRAVKIAIATKDAYKSSIAGNVSSWLSKMFSPVDPRVTTIFEDDGNLLSTSSTAVAFPGQNGETEMLVCGLWDPRGAVHCLEVDI